MITKHHKPSPFREGRAGSNFRQVPFRSPLENHAWHPHGLFDPKGFNGGMTPCCAAGSKAIRIRMSFCSIITFTKKPEQSPNLLKSTNFSISHHIFCYSHPISPYVFLHISHFFVFSDASDQCTQCTAVAEAKALHPDLKFDAAMESMVWT